MGEKLNGFTLVEIGKTVGKHHIDQALATHLLALSAENDGTTTQADLKIENPQNLQTAQQNVL